MAGETGVVAGGDQTVPWFTGKADAEMTGYLQTKGWDKLEPAAAAIEAAKAHRETERFVGIPADERLRLPKDPKDAAWNGVWARLGVPTDPKEYDFNGIAKASGEAIDPNLAEFVRNAAHQLNISKDNARDLAQRLVKQQDDATQADFATKSAALQTQKQELQKSWGKNFDANLFVAKQAAGKLGMTPEQVTALEQVAGYSGVMEILRKVGASIGEDRFVGGGGPGTPAVMTREQAVEKRASLMADKGWAKKYIDGDMSARQEMTALLTMIHGDDTQDSINASKFTAGRF